MGVDGGVGVNVVGDGFAEGDVGASLLLALQTARVVTAGLGTPFRSNGGGDGADIESRLRSFLGQREPPLVEGVKGLGMLRLLGA